MARSLLVLNCRCFGVPYLRHSRCQLFNIDTRYHVHHLLFPFPQPNHLFVQLPRHSFKQPFDQSTMVRLNRQLGVYSIQIRKAKSNGRDTQLTPNLPNPHSSTNS